jgi:RNA polymerase sigma-70 factor (ECF subfamily)
MDIKAFHKLFVQFQPQLKSYLYRFVTDRNDAEDLAHDTFILGTGSFAQALGKSASA